MEKWEKGKSIKKGRKKVAGSSARQVRSNNNRKAKDRINTVK